MNSPMQARLVILFSIVLEQSDLEFFANPTNTLSNHTFIIMFISVKIPIFISMVLSLHRYFFSSVHIPVGFCLYLYLYPCL